MNTIIPVKYPPRLRRLCTANVVALEAERAAQLVPGTTTWQQAIEALCDRTLVTGPRKGALAVAKAKALLAGFSDVVVIIDHIGSRNALLMFATLSYGAHPDRAVDERGVIVHGHVIEVARTRTRAASGAPIAFLSEHAILRMFERGQDLDDPADANVAFAVIGALGFICNLSDKHRNGGMALRIDRDLLLVGGQHRCINIKADGKAIEDVFLDIRTALSVDEIYSEEQQAMLAQGEAAATAVAAWLVDPLIDDAALAESIPALPRRENYPARMRNASPRYGGETLR